MQIILDIIIPVFGIVGLGYVAARFGLFPTEANKGLSRFVFDFAIPALLFRTMATTDLPAEIEWAIWCRISAAATSRGSPERPCPTCCSAVPARSRQSQE